MLVFSRSSRSLRAAACLTAALSIGSGSEAFASDTPTTQPDKSAKSAALPDSPLYQPVDRPPKAADVPTEIRDVGMTRKLGNTVNLGLSFRDSAGEQVRLGDYFEGNTPVLLVLGYYRCPQMCDLVIGGVSKAASVMAKDAAWTPGENYRIVMVSIDPDERAAEAAEKRDYMLQLIAQSAGQDAADKAAADPKAMAFLTGSPASIKSLTEAVGFGYVYLERSGEYAHPAAITVLTSKGVISQYFHGHVYGSLDLRLAMVDASEGKVGTLLDWALSLCYGYDEEAGKYVVMARNVMKLSGVAMLLIVSSLIGVFFVLERRRRSRLLAEAEGQNPNDDHHPGPPPASA